MAARGSLMTTGFRGVRTRCYYLMLLHRLRRDLGLFVEGLVTQVGVLAGQGLRHLGLLAMVCELLRLLVQLLLAPLSSLKSNCPGERVDVGFELLDLRVGGVAKA